ncbi:MAG: Ribulokinase [uncultured Nocardioidaceae bacterium]|uniref:Ribulokinase n=1 Tax=uncultured Nocardioidaceae bacterium TaxID=253824 RepID=A0A6J4M172_9ACTN|nr:MAG: Ribulokinase [uncultured Nocardioidaceae bacterium]
MGRTRYVVGVDFGTLSARAVVVRVADGAELGAATHEYTHGVLDTALPTGRPLSPSWALQDPEDYREALRVTLPAAVAGAGIDPADVIGIGTDFTACTMLPCRADGTPLCEVDDLADRPHAWPKLWKHQAAQSQADRITRLAEERGEPWLARYGGRVSAEGELAKALQVFEEDGALYDRADVLAEAADWIVWQLSGELVRSASTAGYKGLWQDDRYPSPGFLEALAPGFSSWAGKVGQPVRPLGTRAGSLTARGAAWTGLPEGIAVAVGNIDAHATVPAAGSVAPGRLTLILGTSACHMLNADVLREVPGISGVVDGGIVAGSWGYEAGQSGVGDVLAWVTRSAVPASYERAAADAGESLHEHLSRLAAAQGVGEHGLVALDWHSGNRSVLNDHELAGAVIGLTLATRPEDVYRALVEATAFGTRVVVEAFRAGGLPVDDVVVAGGLVRNPFLLQVYADVLGLTLSVIGTEHGAALGAAIHAAVAAGAHPNVPAAAAAMGSEPEAQHLPDPSRTATYDVLFAEYRELHDHFGRTTPAMHRLRALRRAARDRHRR